MWKCEQFSGIFSLISLLIITSRLHRLIDLQVILLALVLVVSLVSLSSFSYKSELLIRMCHSQTAVMVILCFNF